MSIISHGIALTVSRYAPVRNKAWHKIVRILICYHIIRCDIIVVSLQPNLQCSIQKFTGLIKCEYLQDRVYNMATILLEIIYLLYLLSACGLEIDTKMHIKIHTLRI